MPRKKAKFSVEEIIELIENPNGVDVSDPTHDPTASLAESDTYRGMSEDFAQSILFHLKEMVHSDIKSGPLEPGGVVTGGAGIGYNEDGSTYIV